MKTANKKADELRRLAEEMMEDGNKKPESSAMQDPLALVHELDVYQVELEIQSQELRRSQLNAEKLSRSYQELYDFAPVGYLTLDKKKRIVSANLAAGLMLGRERSLLVGHPIVEFVATEFTRSFADFHTKLVSGERGGRCELRLGREDFEGAWVTISGVMVRDGSEKPGLCMLSLTDITERILYEDELKTERTILKSIMDCARNSHLVYLDRDFNFVAVNETYAATCGYRPEEMIGRNHSALYPNAENEALFVKARDSGLPIEFYDRPFVFPDQPERGTTYWDWTLTPVKDESCEVKGLVFSLVETTNRKKTEEQIEQLNRKLRNRIAQLEGILDTSPIGLAIAEDKQGIHIRGNRALEQLLGLPSGGELSVRQEKSAGYRVFSNGVPVPVDQLPMQRACLGETVTGQLLDIERSDGKKLMLYSSAAPLLDENGNQGGAVGAFMDITERVETEKALRESEERLAALTANITEGLIAADCQGEVFFWNPAALSMFGYASLEECRRDLAEFADTFEVRTLDNDRLLPVSEWPMSRVLRGEVLRNWEMRIHRLDQGWEKILAFSGWLIRNIRGEALAFVSTHDITERKQAEEALKKTNAQLSTIIETVPIAIAITDSQGGNIQSNRAFQEVWGGTIPTVNSISDYKPFNAWWMESGQPVLPEEWASAQAVLKGETTIGQMMRIQRFDGSSAFIHNSAAPILDESGRITGSVVAIMDISRLVETEEELRMAYAGMEAKVIERTRELRQKDQILIMQSRQAAMGEMISNIAHQWRQPLNSLGLVIQQLPLFYEKGLLDGDLLTKNVRKSMEIIKHMSATIEDFRNFFKPDREKADFRLKDVIDNVLSLIKESFENNRIRIKVVENADPVVHGFQNELAQSLLNILNNARDTFIERGYDNPAVTITIVSQDGKNVITVADNAGGIPEEIITKVFDPYFTTKGPQHGTGVGLYMSKAIIEKNMGGRLSVRNTGDGAEFRIEL
jgi:PAS domain S-box-containing protein